MKRMVGIDSIPEEVFRENIFKYLSAKDIFNLGECSKLMNFIVVSNLTHPQSTSVQYEKSIQQYVLQTQSAYDNIKEFYKSEICLNQECCCQRYHKRKNVVVIDPLFCGRCKYIGRHFLVEEFLIWDKCLVHQILIPAMLDLSLCNECVASNTYCQICRNGLDNHHTKNSGLFV